jgi:hypothetical protein
MATQAVNQFEMDLPQTFMLRDILPGPAWAPYQLQYRPSSGEVAHPSDEKAEDGNCAKDFLVAIAMEGTLALGVFGIWHFWHLIR